METNVFSHSSHEAFNSTLGEIAGFTGVSCIPVGICIIKVCVHTGTYCRKKWKVRTYFAVLLHCIRFTFLNLFVVKIGHKTNSPHMYLHNKYLNSCILPFNYSALYWCYAGIGKQPYEYHGFIIVSLVFCVKIMYFNCIRIFTVFSSAQFSPFYYTGMSPISMGKRYASTYLQSTSNYLLATSTDLKECHCNPNPWLGEHKTGLGGVILRHFWGH